MRRAPPWIPNGGFRIGPAPERWPDPNFWWEAQGGCWVRARLRDLLAVEMRMTEREVDACLPSEHFRRVQVRFKAHTRDSPAYEPVGSSAFEEYLLSRE